MRAPAVGPASGAVPWRKGLSPCGAGPDLPPCLLPQLNRLEITGLTLSPHATDGETEAQNRAWTKLRSVAEPRLEPSLAQEFQLSLRPINH